MLAQRQPDVLADGERIEQRRALKQHAEALAHLVEVVLLQAHDLLAVDLDRALVGRHQANHVLEKHALAGAAAPHHHDALSLADVEIDAIEHLLGAETLGEPTDPDHEAKMKRNSMCAST